MKEMTSKFRRFYGGKGSKSFTLYQGFHCEHTDKITLLDTDMREVLTYCRIQFPADIGKLWKTMKKRHMADGTVIAKR
jgi:hypothetical protein